MADINQQILNSLQNIEKNTKKGMAANNIAEGRRKGIGNQESDTDDRFGVASKGLLGSFKSLRKEIEKTKKHREQYNKDIINFASNIEKPFKQYERTIRNNIKSSRDFDGTINQLKNSLKTLREGGIETLDLERQLGKVGDWKDLKEAIDDTTDRFNEFGDALDDNLKKQENNLKQAHKVRMDAVKNFAVGMIKASGTAVNAMAALGSEVSLATQGAGFGFADQNIPEDAGIIEEAKGIVKSILGLGSGAIDAIGFGASAQDLARFGATNRQALLAAGERVAGEGIYNLTDIANDVLTNYANELNREFGFKGAELLENISRSFNVLGNLGVPITQDNLQALRQGVETMAESSNMIADDVFAELANLANDIDFQRLALSFNSQEQVMNMLTESFMHLSEAVGLNMKEFIQYQQWLSKQTGRTGSERLVQAGYTRRLAESLGFDDETTNLLAKGSAFYESLNEAQKDNFDVAVNELRARVGEERRRFAGGADEIGAGRAAQAIQTLDIFVAGTGLEELILEGRRESGIIQAIKDAQEATTANAEKDTEALQATSAYLRRIAEGFTTSIFSVGVAPFFTYMTASVATGNVIADMINKGGSIMKILGGLGLVAATGFGAFKYGEWASDKRDSGIDYITDFLGITGGATPDSDIENLGQAIYHLINSFPSFSDLSSFSSTREERLIEGQNRTANQIADLATQMEEAEAEGREKDVERNKMLIDMAVERIQQISKDLQSIRKKGEEPKPERTLGTETPNSESAMDARGGG